MPIIPKLRRVSAIKHILEYMYCATNGFQMYFTVLVYNNNNELQYLTYFPEAIDMPPPPPPVLYFGGFWETLNYFQGFGERRQILLGRRGHYLQGDGEINALFSGIKGAQTPWGPHYCPHQRPRILNYPEQSDWILRKTV